MTKPPRRQGLHSSVEDSRASALSLQGAGTRKAGSALARLEATVGLVDHIGPATAADHAVVPVAVLERLQAVANFHGLTLQAVIPAILAAGKNEAAPLRGHGREVKAQATCNPCKLKHARSIFVHYPGSRVA